MIGAVVPTASRIDRNHGTLKLHRNCGFGEVSNTPREVRAPEIPSLSKTGTICAINHRNDGVAAYSTDETRRGGARNRADRESFALSVGQIANLTDAERHADMIGLPLNRMITIHWQAAGLPLEGMAKATGRFIDLMSKALARHGSDTAWLWVHENCGPKGGHCHLLVHIPPHLVSRLTALQRKWLRRITGRPYRARVIHSKPVGGRLALEANNPDLYAANLEKALSYLVKGADLEAASQFDLEKLQPGGRVIGKRCGTSQNIGTKARRSPI